MPLLEVHSLHARYEYAPILQGVSLRIDAGEIVEHLWAQRRREDHGVTHPHGLGASDARGDTVQRRIDRRAFTGSYLPQGHCVHSGGSPYFRHAERRGESHACSVYPLAIGRAAKARAGSRLRSVSAVARAAIASGQDTFRRRAADAGHRPRRGRSRRNCSSWTSRPKAWRRW